MSPKNNRYALLQRSLSYHFNQQALLEQALSHRSVGKTNNERLEFLGDSLLSVVISEALFLKFPHASEGVMSRLRASLVNGEALAELAREFDLSHYVLLGGGEMKSGGFRRASILADTVEALIGAIYLDADWQRCKSVVLHWYESRLNKLVEAVVEKDPKTRLQEYLQERRQALPKYQLLETLGENHAREFKIECCLPHSGQCFEAVASSKRQAEKMTALQALQALGVVDNESI